MFNNQTEVTKINISSSQEETGRSKFPKDEKSEINADFSLIYREEDLNLLHAVLFLCFYFTDDFQMVHRKAASFSDYK